MVKKRRIMYNPKSHEAEEFISNDEILSTLEYAKANKNLAHDDIYWSLNGAN